MRCPVCSVEKKMPGPCLGCGLMITELMLDLSGIQQEARNNWERKILRKVPNEHRLAVKEYIYEIEQLTSGATWQMNSLVTKSRLSNFYLEDEPLEFSLSRDSENHS